MSELLPSFSKPSSPYFSSGPTKKYPGFSTQNLCSALLGRSHRGVDGVARISRVLDLIREILGIPADYKIALLPGSTCGAYEGALWSLLGARPVDVFTWDVFGKFWVTDVVYQLKLDYTRVYDADFGELPDLTAYRGDCDAVFTWNGTSSGVCIPHLDWIPEEREGLTICDATSSMFAIPVTDWSKLDATAFSWQKGLGGEGGHGILVLSPRAVERLLVHKPAWPRPRIFRYTSGSELLPGLFDEGKALNTPSMLCVEDIYQALRWAKSIGGQPALSQRCQDNASVITAWIQNHPTLEFMARQSHFRSPSSVCLAIKESLGYDADQKAALVSRAASLLEKHGIAYDIHNHLSAPSSFRIWCGPTIETEDVGALLPWLDWAIQTAVKNP